ncbi:MAG: hypothetical protein EXS05_13720 [Planctomycetaceae bacterium]|nr:hypothetical protein [Planctomycetaceae bacterium]
MLFKISRGLTSFVMLALAGSTNTALAQFWCCPTTCCPPPVCMQPTFQTVPVTEMRECRQVVQKPIVETKYVERPVTEYRQVVETKTAEIPTVSYQNVTEYRTVQRDCGQWSMQWYHHPKLAPCQYDNRPDLFGFLNRTGYSLRMALTPDYHGERIYTPNVVAQQVPVTRQVAVRGTQTVNYQVAKVVPIHSTRKVAVNTVRMVAQEIVTQRPVTVMKTIPWGSAYASGGPLAPATTTAKQPNLAEEATAILPKDSARRAAEEAAERSARVPDPVDPESADDAGFNTRESDSNKSNIRGKEHGRTSPKAPALGDKETQTMASIDSPRPIGKWVARKKPQSKTTGPAFPEMIVAQMTAK